MYACIYFVCVYFDYSCFYFSCFILNPTDYCKHSQCTGRLTGFRKSHDSQQLGMDPGASLTSFSQSSLFCFPPSILLCL